MMICETKPIRCGAWLGLLFHIVTAGGPAGALGGDFAKQNEFGARRGWVCSCVFPGVTDSLTLAALWTWGEVGWFLRFAMAGRRGSARHSDFAKQSHRCYLALRTTVEICSFHSPPPSVGSALLRFLTDPELQDLGDATNFGTLEMNG